MELTNEFTVDVPVEEAWAVLTDIERIAPCMPGAALEEVEGDEYRGVVKVKVGPVTTQYRGTASFLERDADAHKAVLKAEGRETRGQGNASATISASLEPAGSGTRVSVVTDLSITGRVAQMGRGVLADVSTKLLGQFVTSLESTVLAGSGPPVDATASESGGAAAEDGDEGGSRKRGAKAPAAKRSRAARAAGPEAGTEPAASAEPAPVHAGNGETGARGADAAQGNGAQPAATVRRIAPEREVAPVDLLEVAGPSVAVRILVPAAVLTLVVVLLRRWRRGRG